MALVNNPIDIIVDKDISINSSIIDNTGYNFNITFAKNADINKTQLTNYFIDQGANSVQYKNDFDIYGYQINTLQIPYSQDVQLAIEYDNVGEIKPKEFYEKFVRIIDDINNSTSDAEKEALKIEMTTLVKEYIIIDPETFFETVDIGVNLLFFLVVTNAYQFRMSYPIVNGNSNKSFIIKLTNKLNNLSFEFTAKTSANKDNTKSSYECSSEDSQEEVELLKNIQKVLVTPNYEPYKLNIQIKEVVQ